VEAMTMMWDWNGASWWWLLMSGGMVLFWGLVAWVIVQVVRGSSNTDAGEDPEAILAARFARGELDAEEYQARLAVLAGRPRGQAPRER
jgi:putative membrane protein